jgi:NTE family protein
MPDTFDAAKDSGASLANAASAFGWSGNTIEPGIAIALSGGGFRAMLFHAGALLRLNELGLLARARRISSVSGGSIAAAYLAMSWRKLAADDRGVLTDFRRTFLEPIVRFSGSRIDVADAFTGLLPWTSPAEQVAHSYEQLFGEATLQDLPDSPCFVFCATNLQTGVLWRFCKPYAGDYVVGRIEHPDTRIAQAVAASSACPPMLSPMVLKIPPGQFANWPNDGPRPAGIAGFREQVILTDGGVYDNHGMEPILKRYMTVFVSDGGAPFKRTADLPIDWIGQLRRVIDVTDNQVRALRRRDLIGRLRDGNRAFQSGALAEDETRSYERMGAYWGIDTDPSRLAPPGALPCNGALTGLLAHLPTRLSTLGKRRSRQLVNWGYAICDRSVRKNYRGPVAISDAQALWPYPDAALTRAPSRRV